MSGEGKLAGWNGGARAVADDRVAHFGRRQWQRPRCTEALNVHRQKQR